MDGFKYISLVIELITLDKYVEVMIDVLIYILLIVHIFKETEYNLVAANPHYLEGETVVGRTMSLTHTNQ